ncbi:MAG: FAD:protein FMN transferase [Candidatus Marinimicrobia bacterium]|nr:FAD:protein FMN transferase [Candidatus Neomarinimicrobiota bacterium]
MNSSLNQPTIKKKKQKQARFIAGLFFIWTLALWNCAPSGEPALSETSFAGFTMGTTYHIRIVDMLLTDPQSRHIHQGVDSLLEFINLSMSTYIDSSEISRFNQSIDTTPQPVSAPLAQVLKTSLEIGRSSSGALDITVMPLVNFYGFGYQQGATHLPTKPELDSLQRLMGLHHLVVTDSTIQKQISALSLDLGAIAKGFGVDAVGDFLLHAGIENFMVEIGGEVLGRGVNSRGQPWQIGIDRPVFDQEPGRQLQHVIQLKDLTIATSGDYRNYREVDGKRISHTIDPRTGKPIEHRLAAVSIIAPTCMIADASATAVMVLGEEAGLKWLEQRLEIEGLLIVRESNGTFRELQSSGFSKYIVK